MTSLQIALLSACGLLVATVAVVLIRTLTFRPKKQPLRSADPVSFDKERAVACLRALVRFPTVSHRNHAEEDEAAFDGLRTALSTLFPHVFSSCEVMDLPDRGLLIRWRGREEGDPSVMMAHYDVVPVVEDGWKKPPFEGVIEDGVLWGRGTLDTKVSLNSALFSADTLMAEGFVPQKDVYFAFSGCEEINGDGARHIVSYFREKGIHPALVLDEGGAVVENVFPGVKGSCGLIGIAEKGMLDVRYTAASRGGHASAPKPHTPVGALAAACVRVEGNPFKMRISPAAAAMFDTLGRRSNFFYRMIFANLWLFSPVIDLLGKKSGGELNALLRTTVAFTQMAGSDASNVIPPKAEMVSNIRLNPGDTVESALAYLRKTVKDESLEVSPLYGTNPSPISRVDCDAYRKIAEAVSDTWEGAFVSPYLMVQCSDSRHYAGLSEYVYRFSSLDLTSEERATIHGHNERIRLETIHRSVAFYLRLLRKC
ncbi:MAG: M20/M25/M40 family metallo-hydrolase [Clostridia bacterium]|nr:M20/M25/M40 family metallo-hydrolase [Clostridia bacterium]